MPNECEKCGGPNSYGATTCQWCGSSMPLPSNIYPPPLHFDRVVSPPGEPRDDEPPDFDPDDHGFWTGSRVVRLGFLVVILIITIAAFSSSNSSSQTSSSSPVSSCSGNECGGAVNVSAVNIVSPDNACGLNGAAAGAFSTGSYATHSVVWWLPLNGASVPCSVESVQSDTPGFTLSANVPLNVTSAETPLLVNIYTPGSYDGTLTLTIQ